MELTIKRRGESGIQPKGNWGGTIAFQAPWAHPVWSEYLLLVYDLDTVIEGMQPSVKHDPSATHEFLLYAIDPTTPIDYSVSLLEQKAVSPLTPPNHGYQFHAESNEIAWARVDGLVDACFRQSSPGVFALSPDSDFRREWDHRMIDGWSLRAP